jgi:hypothetical protein
MPRGRWNVPGDPGKEIDEFLAGLKTWLQKYLRGDFALNSDERADLLGCKWPEVFGEAQDKYRELLKNDLPRLREYRKLQAKLGAESSLSGVPTLVEGAPRLDAHAQEARDLECSGFSQVEIANALNRKYPERRDRKGNKKPFTEGSVRKLLSRRRPRTPDKT